MKLLWQITLLALCLSLTVAETETEAELVNAKDENNEVSSISDDLKESDNIEDLFDDSDENEKKTHKIPGLLHNFTQHLNKSITSFHNFLKPKPKPIIRVTKTLIMEVTKQVTRHPICILHHHKLKPCVPYHPRPKSEDIAEEPAADVKSEDIYIEQPDLVKSVEELEESENDDNIEASSLMRSKRYLKYGSDETPAIEEVKSAIKDDEIEESPEEDGSGRLFFRRAETRTVLSTQWVTKVQRVTDLRVTATLAPQNCYPSGISLPKCQH